MKHVLSLGAGVQSSVLALMAAQEEITPMPDFAVFADTQAEPPEVYDWLHWLESKLPFPIHKVSKGNLTEESLRIKLRKSDGGERVNNLIPFFGLMPNGKKVAAIGRKCTNDYKILPILKKIKQEVGVKRGEKTPKVVQWIGISWDEVQRMKESRFPWIKHRFPLIETQTKRHECIAWMKKHGYPEPPRSACYYCPFHSNDEWRKLRDSSPELFQKAIDFDKDLRSVHKNHNKRMKMEVFLHDSCEPLDEIDFDSDEDKGQLTWDFMAECEGMCGV
jgi:hypothetical protein